MLAVLRLLAAAAVRRTFGSPCSSVEISSIGCMSCGSRPNASRSALTKIAPSHIGATASAARRSAAAIVVRVQARISAAKPRLRLATVAARGKTATPSAPCSVGAGPSSCSVCSPVEMGRLTNSLRGWPPSSVDPCRGNRRCSSGSDLFKGFRLDPRAGGLFRRPEDGVLTPVPIGPRAFQVGELPTRPAAGLGKSG